MHSSRLRSVSHQRACYRFGRRLYAENVEEVNWLIRLTDNHPSWGFRCCYLYLRNAKSFRRKQKHAYRIHKELELNFRVNPRKQLTHENQEALKVPQGINQLCLMDFMHDRLEVGRAFRLPNVIDDFNGEAIVMAVNFALPSKHVIGERKQIIAWHGKPEKIRCAPLEFISAVKLTWA